MNWFLFSCRFSAATITASLLLCVLTGAPASGQQGAPTTSQPLAPQMTKSATADGAGQPGVFYDKQLDLHFNYPVEMKTLDAKEETESGHRNIFGVSGSDDPEHKEAERCLRP